MLGLGYNCTLYSECHLSKIMQKFKYHPNIELERHLTEKNAEDQWGIQNKWHRVHKM